jgi:hypothetical protein
MRELDRLIASNAEISRQLAEGFDGLHAVIRSGIEPLEEMVRRHEAELNRRRQ